MKRMVASVVILVLGMVVGIWTGRLGSPNSSLAGQQEGPVATGTYSAPAERASSPPSATSTAASPTATSSPRDGSASPPSTASSTPIATPNSLATATASVTNTPPASTETSVPPTTLEVEAYIIQNGDTFARIANRLGVSVDVLISLNPGAQPEALQVGQTVNIPRRPPPTSTATSTNTPPPANRPIPTATTLLPSATPQPLPSPTLPPPESSLAITQPLGVTAPSPAAEILQDVARAEAALGRGQFDVAINYSNRTRSTARVVFDLGTAGSAPRLHITTRYENPEGVQSIEQIMIGDKSWQRQPDGQWAAIPAEEGVWGQVQTFLPQADTISSPELGSGGNTSVLHWYDPGRDADVTLRIDPATRIPQELRRVARGTGVVLTVIYSGWNSAVEIPSPVES